MNEQNENENEIETGYDATNESDQHSSDDRVDQTKKKFAFDKVFQEKIVQAMLMDTVWAASFAEVLDVNFFEYAHLKLVASKYIDYHKKYKEFPSMDLLLTIVRDELKNNRDDVLKERIKTFLLRVETKKELGDIAYVKEKSLEFCKKAALQEALVKSVDLAETENYEQIVDVVRKAIAAGNDQSQGLNLFEDIDARYSETYRRTVPTGIPELDQRTVLNGGLGEGEIGFVVAPSGAGKSQILVHLGASAIKHGKNVIYYTFELNERMIGIRFDSHLTDIPSLDCYDNRNRIHEFYKNKVGEYGDLIVKYLPTGQASTQTLRNHIEKLSHKGFIPDLVIVDYAGIMRSSARNDLLRLELKKVCEELRSLAEDLRIPVWSAIQSNKEGMNSDIIDLSNMAESYAQAHVADFVMGLSRQSAQKSTGFGNIFIAKNRAGIDGIKYLIHLDTARSKLKILTDDEAQRFQPTNPEVDERRKILDKFKEKYQQ